MQVKDVIKSTPIAIASSGTVQMAARAMCRAHSSFLAVCNDNDELVGVLTAGDVVRRGIILGNDIFDLNIKDLMTRHAIWCSARENVADVIRLMQVNQVRNLPVKDASGQLVGVISCKDIGALSRGVFPLDLMSSSPALPGGPGLD